MIRILLATHGRMASGMQDSVDLLFGTTDNLFVIDAYIDQLDFKETVEKYIRQ